MGSAIDALGRGEAFGARWTLGSLLLVPLAAVNYEYCAVLSVIMLGAFTTVATYTCKDLTKLSEILPPQKTSRGRRARNLRSFADFLALWMSFLSHLVAVAICARILSATADHVTGGRTRKWLFGYETRALGEPWPDVIGVTVVMVVCAMFMFGLEESVMFTFMLLLILLVFSSSFTVFGLMNLDVSRVKMNIPITLYEIIAAGSPMCYAFGMMRPVKGGQKFNKILLVVIGLPTLVFAFICFLFSNMLWGDAINLALPTVSLLEARSHTWICPVLAAVTVASVGLAVTELCPVLFNILVSLASPEWKVLTRSMAYESQTTGSPVLAVFTAGSLAAILAFACPLAHMVTVMNASHLLCISVQALHYIVVRCVPTTEQAEAGDVEYKRLGKGTASSSNTTSAVAKARKAFWCIPSVLKHTKTLHSIKSKASQENEDRECLLLDDYMGCATDELEAKTSAGNRVRDMATDEVVDDAASDLEVEVSEPEVSSGDDSTDIDAVVKEYKDTIQVVTSLPEASAPLPPSVQGARLSAIGAIAQVIANVLLAVGCYNDNVRVPLLAVGILLWLTGVLTSGLQPAHVTATGLHKAQSLQGPITLLLASLLLTPLLVASWPAVILLAGAGVLIYARCERWCGDLAVRQARMTIQRRKLKLATEPMASRPLHQDIVYVPR